MNLTPLPHQLTGATFLAERQYALLADAPRVGKTGAAIMAADRIGAQRILVITTASGRPVWARGFRDWSDRDIPTRAVYSKAVGDPRGPCRLVISWGELDTLAEFLAMDRWDLVIVDEGHYAKNRDTKRTQALYGLMYGSDRAEGLIDAAGAVWALTGTPIPNAPNDLYPMMRALCPERLQEGVNVTDYEDFLHRYCVVRMKSLSRWTKIPVVVGGRNEAELRARLDGFWLRRTQKDVGIRPPTYELLPIHITASERARIEAAVPEIADILAAAETGETAGLEMALGTLRRMTGAAKCLGVARLVVEEAAERTEKFVLMCWHHDVMRDLHLALGKLGVEVVHGGTSPEGRERAVRNFTENPSRRVFIGQITAAGEAIDLSAAAEMIFVESSFVPKDMAQAALRITNHNQARQCRVRVAALEGSIDEAAQAILIRKVNSIKEVLTT